MTVYCNTLYYKYYLYFTYIHIFVIDMIVHLGFPRHTAIKLVTATIKGSAMYAQSSDIDIATLRANVTSPGGTTASALYELEKG